MKRQGKNIIGRRRSARAAGGRDRNRTTIHRGLTGKINSSIAVSEAGKAKSICVAGH